MKKKLDKFEKSNAEIDKLSAEISAKDKTIAELEAKIAVVTSVTSSVRDSTTESKNDDLHQKTLELEKRLKNLDIAHGVPRINNSIPSQYLKYDKFLGVFDFIPPPPPDELEEEVETPVRYYQSHGNEHFTLVIPPDDSTDSIFTKPQVEIQHTPFWNRDEGETIEQWYEKCLIFEKHCQDTTDFSIVYTEKLGALRRLLRTFHQENLSELATEIRRDPDIYEFMTGGSHKAKYSLDLKSLKKRLTRIYLRYQASQQ